MAALSGRVRRKTPWRRGALLLALAAGALALQWWLSRRLSLNGVAVLVGACLVPALLTLHLLGVPARILIYPTLAMAAAAGVWLVFLAQAAVLHLGYREPALAQWTGSAWHSALFAAAGFGCSWAQAAVAMGSATTARSQNERRVAAADQPLVQRFRRRRAALGGRRARSLGAG